MAEAALRPPPIRVKPNGGGFGAEISGLDLSAPLPGETLAEVKQAFADHSVVWFPDQPLTHDQLEAFTLQLGRFGDDPYVKPMADHPRILEVRREPQETASVFGGAWHSDWSFQDQPPAATLLHAKVVPPVGGDTLYADGYRAYGALSDVMKTLLAPLRAVHSAAGPYGEQGYYARDDKKRSMQIVPSVEAGKSRVHPLVRTHPASGRKALFVNPIYTIGVEGMAEAESAALLGFLFAHMTREAFVYRHRWAPDMLMIWDNRCALHNATGGYDGHRRLMHRVTLAGETPV